MTLQMEYAWSWDFGSGGPKGVGESRFGDISQTPPRGGMEVTIWLGPGTQKLL